MTACNRPQPGPQYWDWRCLRCDEPIADHASAWRRWRYRRAERRTERDRLTGYDRASGFYFKGGISARDVPPPKPRTTTPAFPGIPLPESKK